MSKIKIDTLIEALPYIQKFRDKTIVIKIGGSIVDDPKALENVISNVVFLKSIGMFPVIIHGGGEIISRYLKKLGYEYQFVDGIRITSKEVMEVTQMVLGGLINKKLVEVFEKYGQKAVGLSGKDHRLIIAQKIEKIRNRLRIRRKNKKNPSRDPPISHE